MPNPKVFDFGAILDQSLREFLEGPSIIGIDQGGPGGDRAEYGFVDRERTFYVPVSLGQKGVEVYSQQSKMGDKAKPVTGRRMDEQA